MKAKVTSKTTAAAGSRSIFVINCTATTDTATDLIDELRLCAANKLFNKRL